MDTVDNVDAKFGHERTDVFAVAHLSEEFGELVHAVNLRGIKNKTPEKMVLEDEFADVLLLLAKLADMFDVDFEKAVRGKIDILKERGYI